MPLSENTVKIKAANLRGRLQTLPVKIGDTAVLFTKQRFAQSNWIGNNVEYWRGRKKVTKWGKTPRNKGRALLVDTGRLRRSIRIMNTTASTVTIGSDVPYAKVHNDGFRGEVTQNVSAHTRRKFIKSKVSSIKTKKTTTRKVVAGTIDVKAHERKINMNIPRRRFIGPSPYLDKQVTRIITSEMLKALKQ